MHGACVQTVYAHFPHFVSHAPVEVFIDGAKASERLGHTDGPKCLGFLLPNKLIADTLMNSCADFLSRDCSAFQTQPHNHSVGAGGGVRRLLKDQQNI